MDWIHLARDMNQWRALVNIVITASITALSSSGCDAALLIDIASMINFGS
jgi:hypothetical protein